MSYVYLEDKIKSIFYQDVVHGAVFVYQYDMFEETRMFGMFNIGSEEYIVQTPENITYTTLKSGLNQFEIRKEKIHEIDFNDFLEKVDTTKQATDKNDTFIKKKLRHKRATGLHQLELLIVVDYTVYKYWYDQSNQTSTSQKETEALTSVRQYYAFVITGMDGMFKNIQTSSYTIDIVFAGIVIAQTPSDASWTETIKVTSVTPNQVDASIALGNFQTWNNNPPFILPGHDHAMLFTRYHLRLSSGGIAGLAYLSQVCTSVSQSIVADGFNFLMISVASHELGHCLSSQHDGDGNGCSGYDAYIMASGIGPQTKPATATHPWIFSSCSTAYFTNYINSLDSAGNNCMKTLSPGFDPTGLTPYDQQLAGQLFSADEQCAQIGGTGSSLCYSLYYGDFSTICTVLWCSNPAGGNCNGAIAGDGTHCGDKKWCISGVCTSDSNAPPADDETCLYGDVKGKIFTNGWTCEDMVREAPGYCSSVRTSCCASCVLFPTTTLEPTTDADQQCVRLRGTGSHLCRSPYGGDFSTICTRLWCADTAGNGNCHGHGGGVNGTLCGNKKWCISGVCTSDSNAPAGVETCLYGDKRGVIFSNGWTCEDMVRNAPGYCSSTTACCASCAPPTTTSTTTPATTTTDSNTTAATPSVVTITSPTTTTLVTTTVQTTTDADQQCVQNRGTGSYLCRSPYSGDFSTICTRLWCADTAGNGNCHGHSGGVNKTLCGNKKWCMSGVCTSDSNAPAGVETCLYGDKRGVIFSNGWTCEDMVREAPGYCSSTTACCASCAPPTTTSTTTPASTTTDSNTTAATPSVVTITSPTTTTLVTTTVQTTTDADQQCVQNRGTGSYLCRSPYSGDFSTICTRLWCADTAGNGNCHGHSGGVNKTLCGNKKWCMSGVCTSDSNAPAGVETCLYGDKRGVIFSNGWTCEDMVRNAPSYCSSTTACCASCAPPTTPSTTTPTMTTTTPTTTTTTLTTTTKTPAKTTTTPASITTTPTMTTNIPTTTTLATTTKTNTPTTSTIQSTTKETSTTVQLTKTNETTSTVQPTADKPTTTVQSTLTERTTTTVQPTTIKKTTTTVQPPTSDETPTTVQPTIFEETTTTVQPTTTKETTTTVQSHTSKETTIPGQPPTSEEATTIVKPQSSEKTTTAVQTPTSKGTTTTVQPTTTKETTTTVQPLTSKETTTTVQPSTSKGTTTTVQPSTTTETTTTVQPLTSEETTTTGQPPTSEETITTVQPPTSEETTTTVQAPTSIETTSTVQPTSNAETTSTSQPSTSEVSATIRPTTIEETSTTVHLTKTDETTTIVQQITTDKNVTTVQPPTATAQTSTTERITITFQPTTKEQTTTTVNPISTEHTAISGQRASTEQTIATVLPTTKERRTTVQLSITDKTTKVQHTTTEQTTTTVQPATMTTKPTTTSKTTSQPSQPSVTIEYKYTCRLRLMITVTISLTDTTTEEYQSLFNEVLIALTNYYRQSRSCKQSFRRIVLISIRAGSLIPEYEVYLDEPSPGDVIAAGYDLTTGNGNLTIGNETVEAETSSVTTNNQTSTVTSADNLCDAFNQISSCPDNYGCRINSSTNAPYCALKMIEMDNYSLILQLAVGIPMAFLLFVLIVLLYIVCKSHRQRQTKTKYIEEDLDIPVPKEKSLFAGNMAKRQIFLIITEVLQMITLHRDREIHTLQTDRFTMADYRTVKIC
ncbi:unnamed protein product [Mytilus edulis]|uniref:Peptidase M12B domain-containing protein n=1 Tax=Mytilus edulis TaxID=6550 RepID=A0A8S3T8Q4_MYTED|nr:unnamed protein product [Mytilus edulis]